MRKNVSYPLHELGKNLTGVPEAVLGPHIHDLIVEPAASVPPPGLEGAKEIQVLLISASLIAVDT